MIEEILRIYGFNRIKILESTRADYLANFPEQDPDRFKRRLGEQLVANGYFEIVTNSLTRPAYQQKHQLTFVVEPVEILNKLSEEQGILRQTLLFTGLEVLAYNFNRKQRDLKFYEFGRVYGLDKGAYKEHERLAIYLAGDASAENWQHKTREVHFHDLGQQVARIMEKSSCGNVETHSLNDPLFDFGLLFRANGKEIGKAGKVKTAIAKDFGIKHEIFYADLDASLLFQLANPKFEVRDVPKFPEVKRDLSLVIDKSISFDEVRRLVEKTEKKLVKEVTVFDVYEAEGIPDGKKAYALAFTLLDETKTLTDEEIEKTMNKLMAEFEKKLGAVIRK